MKSSQYALRSYSALTAAQRRRILVCVALQICNSLLDILGVALIGLMLAQSRNNEITNNSSRLNDFTPSALLGVTQTTGIILLIGAAALCFTIKAVAAPMVHRKILLILGDFSTDLSSTLEKKLFDKDILFKQRRTSQETAFIFTEATFICFQGLLGFTALVLSEVALILFMLALLLILNVPLTLFIVIYFTSILILLNKFSERAGRKHSNILNSSLIDSRSAIQEVLNSYREIYVSQNVDNFIKLSTKSLRRSVDSRANLNWLSLLPKYILDVCIILGIVIIGGFATVFISQQSAITLCVLFLVSASRIMPSLLRLSSGLQGMNNCIDATDRLYVFIEEMEEIGSYAPAPKFEISKSNSFGNGPIDIRVKNLHFVYPDSDNSVIGNLSLDIPFGEFLAIAGPSGSGKSTLVDLIMGVIDGPDSAIQIDGLNPRHFVQSNPGLIGYVPQKVSLMNRSLKENIAIGLPSVEINETWVTNALEKAALADFVLTLPDGLNTTVGENGYNFSGGQIQRIGLARALYTRPKILILDEATSALDAETENAVSESIKSLTGEITLIVVAHRLATVRKATRILYLGEGNIYEIGDFDILREKVPSFDNQAKLLGL